jgi:hypothetical protein
MAQDPTEYSTQDSSKDSYESAAGPNFSPPEEVNRPLWRSLVANIADRVAPEKLPPIRLMSRPLDVGRLLSDRLGTPWYRTVFTNLGDVISPEQLPPLELESRPVDVGELIGDQLSHLWISSFLRNLADLVAPERQPELQLASKPDPAVLPAATMLLPRWSSVIDGPKIFLPDAPKPGYGTQGVRVAPAAAPAPPPKPPSIVLEFLHDMHRDLKRDVSRSRLRARIWMSVAAAQIVFLVGSLFWHF